MVQRSKNVRAFKAAPSIRVVQQPAGGAACC